jgi:hypothetical protein
VVNDDDLLDAVQQAARASIAADDSTYPYVFFAARSALGLKSSSDAVEISAAIARSLVLQHSRGVLRASSSPINTKAEKRDRVYRTGSSVLFDNCELCAPDGTLLARISKKKAAWYGSEGYGELITVEEDGKTGSGAEATGSGAGARPAAGEPGGPLLRVRMFRQPGGKGHSEDEFYLTARENVCNLCGITAEKATREDMRLFRIFVCPRSIRALLPQAAKSYSNHDMLLACSTCKPNVDKVLAVQLKLFAAQLGVEKSALPENRTGSLDGESHRAAEENSVGSEDDASDDDTSDAAATAGGDESNDGSPSVAVLHLQKLTRPIVHRQAPPERTLEIIRLLCAPNVVATARSVAQAQRVRRPPRPRGKVDARRLEARKAAQDAAVAAFSISWATGSIFSGDVATANAAAAAGLDAALVIALYNAPTEENSATSKAKGSDTIAMALMERVYDGGAEWARAETYFSPFIPQSTSTAPGARGTSGLLLETEGRAAAVVARFRAAFVKICQPRALPVAWRVDAPVFPTAHTRMKKEEQEPVAVKKAKAAGK